MWGGLWMGQFPRPPVSSQVQRNSHFPHVSPSDGVLSSGGTIGTVFGATLKMGGSLPGQDTAPSAVTKQSQRGTQNAFMRWQRLHSQDSCLFVIGRCLRPDAVMVAVPLVAGPVHHPVVRLLLRDMGEEIELVEVGNPCEELEPALHQW
jgi:hypothetical protein